MANGITSEEAKVIVDLINQIIGFFQEYIRDHELTDFLDDKDPNHVKPVKMYLIPEDEVGTLQELYKKAAREHWGIEL